jgi:hypothetical protein
MDNSQKFLNDLEKGKTFERLICEKLGLEFNGLRVVEGYQKGFDLIDNTGYKIEVKTDFESEKTDNIAIEIRCRNSLSGLATTKAKEWIHIFWYKGKWYFLRCSVSDLKGFIRSNWKYLEKVKGGDNDLSEMVLIDKDLIMN